MTHSRALCILQRQRGASGHVEYCRHLGTSPTLGVKGRIQALVWHNHGHGLEVTWQNDMIQDSFGAKDLGANLPLTQVQYTEECYTHLVGIAIEF